MIMYVMSLTFEICALDEGIVSYLTRWTQISLDNVLYFYFYFDSLGWVPSVIIKEYSSWWSAVWYLYDGKLLFVDKYWKKSENMSSHHFLIWRSMLPLRVMEDKCLLNCDACEGFSGDLRSGYWMRYEEGCL